MNICSFLKHKKHLFIFIPLFVFITTGIVLGNNNPQYYSNKIYVKFREDSETAKTWLKNNRKGAINNAQDMFGVHTSKPFISNNLYATALKKTSNNLLSAFQNPPISKFLYIAEIEYENGIDAAVLSKKLMIYPDIEYAEPVPIYYTDDIPNDSLFHKQLYLQQVKALDVWGILNPSRPSVVMAVVDVGVYYMHEDLLENIYYNQGEIGTDGNGNSKQNNDIDDDGNGYIDDYVGWDFADEDNNPIHPISDHGTHVAGIAAAVINNVCGIAGVASNVKIMPLKVAKDSKNSTLINPFEAVFYAAMNGASVINCSFSTMQFSYVEHDFIKLAAQSAIIIASAGNTGICEARYPAALAEVLSVAAVYDNDTKTSFSAYHYSVDVSAPGNRIISTVLNNSYAEKSGTSMSAPIVAGIAAMVKNNFPEFSPEQLLAQIKHTTDTIDNLNPNYIKNLGTGRVNALKAIANPTYAMEIKKYSSSIPPPYYIDDEIDFVVSIQNILSNVNDVTVDISSDYMDISNNSIYIGNMQTHEVRNDVVRFSARILPNCPENHTVVIRLNFHDKDRSISSDYMELHVNSTYSTMDKNNITCSFNNIGNIGFTDFPYNYHGMGFLYKDYANILFESGIIIATESVVLSNIRNKNQQEQSKGFVSNGNIYEYYSELTGWKIGRSEYQSTDNALHINVVQTIYQNKNDALENTLFLEYKIINNSLNAIDSLYFGNFFDFDIAYTDLNKVVLDNNNIATTFCTVGEIDPVVAIKLLTQQPLNFFANNNLENSISFSDSSKKSMIANGIVNTQTDTADVSFAIGSSWKIMPNDTMTIVLAITANNEKKLILSQMQAAEAYYNSNKFINNIDKLLPSLQIELYPNPVADKLRLNIPAAHEGIYTVKMYNIATNNEQILINDSYISDNYNSTFDISDLNAGTYLVVIENAHNRITRKIIVVR